MAQEIPLSNPKYFSTNFFSTIFLAEILTYNLLSIASFRIGVPYIDLVLFYFIFPIFRVELNGSRNTTVQSQRYVNDLEAQRKQLEARLHAEAENHKHYINTVQGQK